MTRQHPPRTRPTTKVHYRLRPGWPHGELMLNDRYLRRRTLRPHTSLIAGAVWRRSPTGVVVEIVDGLPSASLSITVDDRRWALALDSAGCGRLDVEVDADDRPDRVRPIEIRHRNQLILTGHIPLTPAPPTTSLDEETIR